MEELCHVSGQLYAVLPVGGESFILNVARIVCEDFRGVMGINLRKSEKLTSKLFLPYKWQNGLFSFYCWYIS